MTKILRILCLSLIFALFSAHISLQQYEQLEKDSPQVIFQLRSDGDMQQYTPNIQKLVFITPWNKRGLELTLKYASKLDYVSPCWFDLNFVQGTVVIQNEQNFNKTFVQEIKTINPRIKILPRIYVAGHQHSLIQYAGSTQSQLKQTVQVITNLLKKYKIDGFVWDTPFNFLVKSEKAMGINAIIVQIINSVKINLPPKYLVFYNMANPMNQPIANQLYNILQIDGLLIQNYDSNDYAAMIKSSIAWVKSIQLKNKPKIFILLPFFSRRQGQGINTMEVYSALDTHGVAKSEIHKHNGGICHFVQSATKISSYVPCFSYFKQSFAKIEESGLNVGFWEGGNGLENYYTFM